MAAAGVNSDALQVAVETIAARATFEGETREVHVRIAEHEGAIYIDIGDPSWQAIQVTEAGWEIIADAPSSSVLRHLRSLSQGSQPRRQSLKRRFPSGQDLILSLRCPVPSSVLVCLV
jgi:hypothetical protein